MIQHGSVLDQVAKMAFKSHTILYVLFILALNSMKMVSALIVCYALGSGISVATIGITKVELGSASE